MNLDATHDMVLVVQEQFFSEDSHRFLGEYRKNNSLLNI